MSIRHLPFIRNPSLPSNHQYLSNLPRHFISLRYLLRSLPALPLPRIPLPINRHFRAIHPFPLPKAHL